MVVLLGIPVLAAVLTAILTLALIRYSVRLSLIRAPNERSSHSDLTPHGGGLAIVAVYLATLPFVFWWFGMPASFLALLIGAGGMVAAVSLYDDLRHVSISSRLSVHFIVAASAISLLVVPAFKLTELNPKLMLAQFVLVLGLVWWMNLFNFMDGIDGIASVEAIYLCIGLVLLSWIGDHSAGTPLWLIASMLSLAGAVSGFLIHNWSPARIFMGDVGSIFLGFTIAAFGLILVKLGLVSPWACLILAGVFVVDATSTLLSRLVNKEPVFRAHRSHLYQRLSQHLADTGRDPAKARARAHRLVCTGVLVLNFAWLLPWAVFVQSFPHWGSAALMASWTPLVAGFYFLRAYPIREREPSRSPIQ